MTDDSAATYYTPPTVHVFDESLEGFLRTNNPDFGVDVYTWIRNLQRSDKHVLWVTVKDSGKFNSVKARRQGVDIQDLLVVERTDTADAKHFYEEAVRSEQFHLVILN